jgi:hypothetical protein
MRDGQRWDDRANSAEARPTELKNILVREASERNQLLFFPLLSKAALSLQTFSAQWEKNWVGFLIFTRGLMNSFLPLLGSPAASFAFAIGGL